MADKKDQNLDNSLYTSPDSAELSAMRRSTMLRTGQMLSLQKNDEIEDENVEEHEELQI